MKAIQISTHGGPEVLEWVELPVPQPDPGQLLLRQTAIGLNYIDTYHRTGLYPVPMPFIPGMEAVGVVEALGEGVTGFAVGDRVAYAWPPIGAYAEYRVFPAAMAVKVPEGIADDIAAGIMLKGCTVEYLVRRTFAVQPGQTVLWHAAAGGVGLLAVQWLKAIGATVIGTVGSQAKAELARAAGCDHIILYREQDVAARVREITAGKGVPVVYDSVGKDTFVASLDSLSPRGLLVSFGNASGPVTGVDLGILATKGSVYVTRPTIVHYYATPEDRAAGAGALFDMVRSGRITPRVDQRYALKDAAHAHHDLEARATTGSTVLIP
ncbi:quinone oxidoreductase family protein [Parapedomonas caeni]